ncbi:MAG: DUF86 domain-containing protein [Candidatus Gribaldobacteria bacterium]|nr:DUF86 domain-containing protein [Candidatus Gribaldobacteria bacterium]
MKKDPKIFLSHILESIEAINSYTGKLTKKEFAENGLAQDAVICRIQVIGEAVKNLPAGLRREYKHILWSKATGMRDVMVHDYFGIDKDIVWKTIKEDLPTFQKEIQKVYKELGGQEKLI